MRGSIGRAASALVVAGCAGLALSGCAAPRGPLTAGGEQQAPPGIPWLEASSGSRACIPVDLDEGSDFWFGNAHTNDGADDATIRGVALRGADNLELVEAVVTGTEDAIGAVTDPWASGRSWDERVPAAGATVPAGETVMVVVRVRPIDAAVDGTRMGRRQRVRRDPRRELLDDGHRGRARLLRRRRSLTVRRGPVARLGACQ